MTSHPTTVVVITGHPGSGKTTLARYLAKALDLPVLCKDDIKEILYDTLGWSNVEVWNQLSVATWTLLYHHVEILLAAHTHHIVEANFVPTYADPQWQALARRFNLQVIQVRCECDANVQLARYRERILSGQRHPGHRDGSDTPDFYAQAQQGPLPWITVECEHVSVNTTALATAGYDIVAKQIQDISFALKPPT